MFARFVTYVKKLFGFGSVKISTTDSVVVSNNTVEPLAVRSIAKPEAVSVTPTGKVMEVPFVRSKR
jgi:hypothetical protein